MLRFISHLIGKPYETCKSCETLKSQLNIVNLERQQLLDTILGLVKPEVIVNQNPITVTGAVGPKAVPWRIRQQELERNSRAEAKTVRNREEEIAKLEAELNIETKDKEDASQIKTSI